MKIKFGGKTWPAAAASVGEESFRFRSIEGDLIDHTQRRTGRDDDDGTRIIQYPLGGWRQGELLLFTSSGQLSCPEKEEYRGSAEGDFLTYFTPLFDTFSDSPSDPTSTPSTPPPVGDTSRKVLKF